jgi:hypothetical protein
MNAAINATKSLFANPNLMKAAPDQFANWIAVDILRRLNVDEIPPVRRWLKRYKPDIYAIIQAEYPHRLA